MTPSPKLLPRDKGSLANREERLAYHRAYHHNNGGKERDIKRHTPARSAQLVSAYRRRKYGITVSDMERMLSMQGYRCAVCSIRFGEYREIRPHVDHDHQTGEVRGLLCLICNLVEGYMSRRLGLLDMPEFGEALAQYLHNPPARPLKLGKRIAPDESSPLV